MADLKTDVSGVTFANPVLPAAGPNVLNGRLMCEAAQGGAGGLVSKTVCLAPASDPRPTIRRYGARGLMNAETWSETPLESYLEELHTAKKTGLPLIVSIGYQPDQVSRLGKLIAKEIEPAGFEFSTHYTGKSTQPLVDVASALRQSVSLPIWIKLSPNFPDLEELALAVEPLVDGFVAVNSYGPVLDIDTETIQPLLGSSFGQGWLSGSPLLPISLGIVYRLRQSVSKPIIGVGGIARGTDAVKYLMAGASLVQVCSAAIREGNGIYGKIACELSDWLDGHGYATIGEIANIYHANLAKRRTFARKPTMVISAELCTGCGACIRRCVHGALSLAGKPERAAVQPDRCIGCGFCQDFCPESAMILEE